MPIYCYRCPDCGQEFERLELAGREYSPICADCDVPLDRVWQPFAAIVLADPPVKLTGWRKGIW